MIIFHICCFYMHWSLGNNYYIELWALLDADVLLYNILKIFLCWQDYGIDQYLYVFGSCWRRYISLMTSVQPRKPTWWKEKTKLWKLSSSPEKKKKVMDSRTKINTTNIFYVGPTTLYGKTEPSLYLWAHGGVAVTALWIWPDSCKHTEGRH